jgi:hypothetical protein
MRQKKTSREKMAAGKKGGKIRQRKNGRGKWGEKMARKISLKVA